MRTKDFCPVKQPSQFEQLLKSRHFLIAAFAIALITTLTIMNMPTPKTTAYLQITLDINATDRGKAANVFLKYKETFLSRITGATSKDLLIRAEDVQVLHGFESEADAKAYLTTDLFEKDVVRELKPFLQSGPNVEIYTVFAN